MSSLGKGLLPDGTKPLLEPILTYNQRYSVALTWEQLHKEVSNIGFITVHGLNEGHMNLSNYTRSAHELNLQHTFEDNIFKTITTSHKESMNPKVGKPSSSLSLEGSLYQKQNSVSLNSLWPSDVIWRQESRSTLAQVMACCLTAPSHYLNRCWLMISEVLWHSPNSNFTENTQDIYRWNEFEIY